MTRHARAAWLVRALITAGIAWAAPVAAHAQTETIKINIPAIIADFAPILLALDKGYFREEGLNVELMTVAGGVAVPALVSGSLQFTTSSGSALGAAIRGARLKVIFASLLKAQFQLWSTKPEAKTLVDLKGQPVMIYTRGGSDEIALRILLKREALPPSFVALTPIGQTAARMAAMSSGAQHFAVLTNSEVIHLNRAGVLRNMIFDFTKAVEMVQGGLTTTDSYLDGNRVTAKAVVRALRKGQAHMRAFKDDAIEALQKRQSGVNREILASDVEAILKVLNDDGEMSVDAAERELKVRGEILGLPESRIPAAKAVFDFTLAKEVNTELRSTGWKPRH